MRTVTFSGGTDGRNVIFSGGDNGKVTVEEKPLKQVDFLNYPNITIGGDPQIEQRVTDLENKEHLAFSSLPLLT